MKRSAFTGLSAMLLLLFSAGCQKETRISKTDQVKTPFSTKQQDLKMWWDTGREPGAEDIDYGCEGVGGNCLPEVVVTPKLKTLLIDFAQSTNPGDFANADYPSLSKVIDGETLNEVIKGELNVSMRGEIGIGKTGYLKFTSGNGTVVTVYPFTQETSQN